MIFLHRNGFINSIVYFYCLTLMSLYGNSICMSKVCYQFNIYTSTQCIVLSSIIFELLRSPCTQRMYLVTCEILILIIIYWTHVGCICMYVKDISILRDATTSLCSKCVCMYRSLYCTPSKDTIYFTYVYIDIYLQILELRNNVGCRRIRKSRRHIKLRRWHCNLQNITKIGAHNSQRLVVWNYVCTGM